MEPFPAAKKLQVESLKDFVSIEGYSQDYYTKLSRLRMEEPHLSAYMAWRVEEAMAVMIPKLSELYQGLYLRSTLGTRLPELMAEAFWLGRGDKDFHIQQDLPSLATHLNRLLKLDPPKDH